MLADIHTVVRHNLYGKGEVTKITDDKVYVLFGNQQRIFPYPDAFEKGFLLQRLRHRPQIWYPPATPENGIPQRHSNY